MRLRRLSVALVLSSLLFALMAWGYSVLSKPRLTEDSLRDVSGIEINVEEALVSPKGLSVNCLIENQTRNVASSIVFTVEITTENGQVLAANPLANMLGLKPDESRAIQVLVPSVPELPPLFFTRARVDLVRWQQ